MRIIGGEKKGLRLKSPPGRLARPTTDRVRENTFNLLQGRVAGARVLDLFAGTGALGLEALSRQACRVVLVERDPAVCRILRENVRRVRGEDRTEVFCMEALRYLRNAPAERFSLVFLDPPYRTDLAAAAARLLRARDLLTPDATVVWERPRTGAPAVFPGYCCFREAAYGDTGVLLLAPCPGEPEGGGVGKLQ